MNVLIVASPEKRQRYKFICTPLKMMGHRVAVMNASPLCKYIFSSLKIVLFGHKPDIVIVIGVGLSTIPIFIVSKIVNVPFLVRLGGDPIRDKKSNLAYDLKNKKYGHWFKEI